MSTTLPSQYDPRPAQQRWYAFWEQNGFFHAVPDNRRPYCIVIPPPNVTGALHMGHALNNTLQDVLIRWRRMQGWNTLWVPGTDHAGIATQAVVERRLLEEEGKNRHDLGRHGLVQRIWAWKDDYEARILSQLRQLGCSCDWQRTRFTLDDICARAVRETFFRLFRDGLIYRGKRLVNWDTHLQTAVADDEISYETVQGHLWTFRYPLKDAGPDDPPYVRIATTRPETMLGDTAVAVHPRDPRYQRLIGRMVELPLTGRDIPIIADGLLVDPEFGTGCVKVTPAHDPNDYETGLRHGLPMINILNPDGTINENGGRYAGMNLYQAREAVVADLDSLGLLEGLEDYQTQVGHSDRSKTPIEPYLSDQWFVRMERLAEAAMAAVRDGRVVITPARYAKTYLDWLGEKRDWCISRQLWWGHRIPVWRLVVHTTGADWPQRLGGRGVDRLLIDCWGRPELLAVQVVARPAGEPVPDPAAILTADRPQHPEYELLVCLRQDEPDLIARLQQAGFEQDPDVLDTWFSSALWPHSTLGWPDQTADLDYYYPTSVLVTSRDIITLWVARMVMTGLYNCGQVPFHQVYVHSKILDGFGQTMSKSKGNGVDPLDIIDRYGTDALRFGLTALTTETQDARMPVGYACPHCNTIVAQRLEHQRLKPIGGRKPRIRCPNCKNQFQFSSPNFDPDPDEPVAGMVSERFEQGRNFANKLWNAARFALMNLDGYQPAQTDLEELADEERWILSRLAATIEAVTGQLEQFRFSDVARSLYEFSWAEFCDWYIEMSKLRLNDPATRPVAQRVLATVLDHLLRLLHPVMPYLTEHLWQALAECAPQRGLPACSPPARSVMIAPWPGDQPQWRNAEVERRMSRLQELIKAIRNIRSQFRVAHRSGVAALVRCQADVADQFRHAEPFIRQLATVDRLEAGAQVSRPADAAAAVSTDWELYVPLTGLIDRAAEIRRNRKILAEVQNRRRGHEAKLANERFLAKAPPEVIERHRQLAAELRSQEQAIEQILQTLDGAA